MKSNTFFEAVKRALTGDGVAVFNLHKVERISVDLEVIRETFARSWELPVPDSGNIIVIAAKRDQKLDRAALDREAARLGLPWVTPLIDAWITVEP